MQQAVPPIRLIPASKWVKYKPSYRKLLANHGGAVPVNDVYIPFWERRAKIELYYGSYGSGKSDFIAAKLIRMALQDEYFKCFFGRKQYVDIWKSCFATIIKVMKRMRVHHLFHYSDARNSSMYIKCIINGNEFIPFGSDNPDTLKSADDVTHFWCEELDAYNDMDFRMIYSRLRTITAKTQFIGSFNTEKVYEDHWIRRYFFPETVEDKSTLPEIDILSGVEVVRLKTNYQHNHFQDPDYLQTLRISSGGDIEYLEAISMGAWGVINNKSPWLRGFNYRTHVRDTLPVFAKYDVYLSFDFNNDPFACTAWQFSPHMGTPSSFIHCVKEFSGNMKIEEMCQRILAYFPNHILHICGDRNGDNEDLGRNETLYAMLGRLLGVPKALRHLNKFNLEHADSRHFLNVMFNNYPNIYISLKECPGLVRQCRNARPNPKSKKPHELLKDRNIDGGIHKLDEFDSMRYFFQSIFHKFALKKYLAIRK